MDLREARWWRRIELYMDGHIFFNGQELFFWGGEESISLCCFH